jgi:Arabinose efflux permease
MSDPSRPPPSWYAWYVAGMLTLANVSGYIDRQILVALVGPIEREFGISDVQMSYLIGLGFAIFYTLLGLPIARWADRSNRRNIMAGGVALWSVFTTLCATATSFGRLLLCRIGVGVGEATINPASISLLSDYFPPERRSRAMSMYSLGVFLGSGVGYFIGGWVVQLVSVHAAWSVPVIGTIRPWQSAFLAVGLPGFAIALLLFTVREPPRAEVRAESARIPIRALAAYVSRHRRVFTMHSVGFAMSALVNFGIAAWLPTFFRRTYGWDEAAALRIQGLLTMSIGVAAVVAGGWLSDWFVRRGRIDGPIRVGIIASTGMLVFATAYPLMPTATLAVIGLAIVNFFAALPWGAASAAVSEMYPAPIRAQGAALYFLVLSLLSGTLGPTSVALFTDHVFGRAGVRYSLAVVAAVGSSITIILLAGGLDAYRRIVDERNGLIRHR